MKRRVFLLAISVLMILAICCSCGSKVVKEVEKNPTGEILDSINNTVEAMTADNALLKTFAAACEKGCVSLELPDALHAKVYNDVAASKSAISLINPLLEEEINIYVDGSKVAVENDAAFGDVVYGVDLKSLYGDLEDSKIWEAVGEDFETFDKEYGEEIKNLCDSFKDSSLSAVFKNFTNNKSVELLNKLNECVTDVREEVLVIEGPLAGIEVDSVVIEYKFDKAAISDISNLFADWVDGSNLSADVVADVSDNAAAVEDVEEPDYNISVSFYLNAESKDIMKLDFSGEVVSDNTDVEGEGDTLNNNSAFSLVCNFGKKPLESNTYNFVFTLTEGEEVTETVCNFYKNVTDQIAEYKLEYIVEDNTSVCSLVIDKEQKSYEILVEPLMSLVGSYELSENFINITVDFLDILGSSQDLDLSLVAMVGSEVPEIPTFTDFMKLSLEEYEKLFYGEIEVIE